MSSRYYASLLIASLVGDSLAKAKQHTTTKSSIITSTTSTSASISTTTSPTSTSSILSTTSSPTPTCAAAGASCSATPCCDESLGCFSEPNLANIPTYTCVIPCAFEYGQCGGITWPGPYCCQPGLTCVNEGSPYFYNCQS